MQSDQINELAAALAKAQAKMENATMNKVNPHFKSRYADLASVLDAIREPLGTNGLSVAQTTEIRDGGMVLRTTLMHASGQWMAGEYPLPATARPQEMGSALTYARRYSLAALVCNSADEDDDANAAEDQKQKVEARGKSPIKPQAVQPPVNPDTGEIGPHKITASDEIKWGSAFVAAIRSAATEIELRNWIEVNRDALDTLKGGNPKIYDRVMANIDDRRANFKQQAA